MEIHFYLRKNGVWPRIWSDFSMYESHDSFLQSMQMTNYVKFYHRNQAHGETTYGKLKLFLGKASIKNPSSFYY